MNPLALTLLFAAVVHAEPEWVASVPGHDARMIAGGESFAAMVHDSPKITKLRFFPTPHPNEIPSGPALTIHWGGIDPATEFSQVHAIGAVYSTLRLNDATMTRTMLVNGKDRAVFIHLLANKPGALSFRIGIGEAAEVENRRDLVLADPACRVTIWPFESEVTPEAHAISVRGEGEALIVWNFGPASLWDDLAKRYDPGITPPNPAKIWLGLYNDQALAAIPPLEQTPPPH